MVYLTTDDNGVRIDSTRVDNGSFLFSGVVAYPVIASVSVKGAPVEAMKSMQIVLDDSDIFVNLITHTLMETIRPPWIIRVCQSPQQSNWQ